VIVNQRVEIHWIEILSTAIGEARDVSWRDGSCHPILKFPPLIVRSDIPV
jgi:hypothetical protein